MLILQQFSRSLEFSLTRLVEFFRDEQRETCKLKVTFAKNQHVLQQSGNFTEILRDSNSDVVTSVQKIDVENFSRQNVFDVLRT